LKQINYVVLTFFTNCTVQDVIHVDTFTVLSTRGIHLAEKSFPSLYHPRLWDLPTWRQSEKSWGSAKSPCIFMVCRL